MRQIISATVLALVMASSTVVAAQDDGEDTSAEAVLMEQERLERARFLYDEAVACTEAQDWECAERTFRTIMGLRDAPAVRYSLALALYELGRYPEAARLLESVENDAEATDALRQQVADLQGQMSEAAARLNVVLGPGAVGLSVQIDGDTIPPDQLSGPVPVAEGTRVVSLHADQDEVARESVDVVAGETASVEIDAPLVAAGDVAPVEEQSSGEELPEWAIWTIIGGGSALLIATIIIVVAVTTSGVEGPIQGDFEPGVLRWD